MKRQKETNPTTHPQGDLGSPGTPTAACVCVGTTPSPYTSSPTPTVTNGNTENSNLRKHGSGSGGDGEFVLISGRDSISDCESDSRRSSGTEIPSPSSATRGSSVRYSISSSSNSVDPSSLLSPQSSVFQPNVFAQNADLPGNSGNIQSTALLGNTGSVQGGSSGTDIQNVALGANFSSVNNFVLAGNTSSIPNPAFFGNIGVNQSAGNTGSIQNAALFGSTSNIQSLALAGNTSNLLAANPGPILDSSSLLYNGGTFLPTATSGMAMLPQAGYDPGTFLLQQQYALSPDLLAVSLGHTLSLSQTQAMPQSLDFLKAQVSLSQTQPVPQSLDLLHPQASLPQNVNLQQPLGSPAQAQPAPNSLDSLEPHVTCPPMGHSFDVLSAMVAASQAMVTSPSQSPTTQMSSTLIGPQTLPLGSASGLPPSLTGLPPLNSSDLIGNLQHKAPQAPTENVGVANHSLNASYSSNNGHEQTISGAGSPVPSCPSVSNPTFPNSDLQGNAQQMRVEPRYDRPWDKGACMRCGKKVYTMEKLGPVKDVLYHKTCFTCVACNTLLNLKNFHTNDAELADLNVYCGSHKPSVRANPLDSRAIGIKRALTVPRQARVNEQIRGGPQAKSIHIDSKSVSISSAMHAPAPDLQASIKQREGAWFREQRKYEGMPPQDVVRHDEQTQKYEGSRSLYYNNPS